MKRYLLICTNESHEVVSVKSFKTKEEAHESMKTSLCRELNDRQESEREDYVSNIYDDCAYVSNLDYTYSYYWEIAELEIE